MEQYHPQEHDNANDEDNNEDDDNDNNNDGIENEVIQDGVVGICVSGFPYMLHHAYLASYSTSSLVGVEP